jgi:hypothetical protein
VFGVTGARFTAARVTRERGSHKSTGDGSAIHSGALLTATLVVAAWFTTVRCVGQCRHLREGPVPRATCIMLCNNKYERDVYLCVLHCSSSLPADRHTATHSGLHSTILYGLLSTVPVRFPPSYGPGPPVSQTM